jgi:hypothetical protein
VVPPCSGRISRVRPYSRANQLLHYRTITFCGWPFNAIRAVCWLIRFRSALLTESLLLSFPLATKMFQFTRFASHGLYIQPWMTHKEPGCPIRKSRDRNLVTSSPGLIAGSYVLHRLLTPRHPSHALIDLIASTECRNHLISQTGWSVLITASLAL